MTLTDFILNLSSSSPTPGGGGAAALVGAIGMACGHMTASLTIGKKKYADLQPRVEAFCREAAQLETALLEAIREDADCFAPLAAAYRIPKEDPARGERLEAATLGACAAPEHIMALCCRGIDLTEEIASCCSRLALSDAGCAAAMLRAALESAALNLFINTAALQDRAAAEAKNRCAADLLREYGEKADRGYRTVRACYFTEEL